MKQLKRRWIQEIDAHIPPLSEQVRSTSIERKPDTLDTVRTKRPIIPYRVYALACSLILIITCILYCALRTPPSIPTVDQSIVMTVDINPSICLTTDKDGTIKSITALNADADILLSANGAQNLIGQPLSDALVAWVSLAAKHGYLDKTDKGILQISCTEKENTDLMSVAKDATEHFLTQNGYQTQLAVTCATVEELCAVLGVTAESEELLASAIRALPPLYTDRLALSEDTMEELTSLYQHIVLGEQTQQKLLTAIQSEIEQAESLSAIFKLNQAIIKHDASGGRDYFTCKFLASTPFFELDAELLPLMTQMEEALALHEATYGYSLDSILSLTQKYTLYAALPLEELSALIETFSVDNYYLYESILQPLLSENESMRKLNRLFFIPDEREDIANIIKCFMKEEASLRAQQHLPS